MLQYVVGKKDSKDVDEAEGTSINTTATKTATTLRNSIYQQQKKGGIIYNTRAISYDETTTSTKLTTAIIIFIKD
jgi:hypothetical protein